MNSESIESTKPIKYSIDRKARAPSKKTRSTRVVKEEIPDEVSQMVVEEVLRGVGNADWNDPLQVSATIAKIMSIDTSQPVEKWADQVPYAYDQDRTILLPARKNATIPWWCCQSLIRVDEQKGHRYIRHKGAKYNKIDIVFGSEYFKEQMDRVAKYAGCRWKARWGNARREENRLFQETRPGDHSWLERCVEPLLTEKDTNGINIKNLVMIEFKRKI